MEARERWQALQARLTAARNALQSGDREQALANVSAALEIDPSFLAAVALRDRILLGEPIVPVTPAAAPPPVAAPPLTTVAVPTPARPLVSADGYAKFEQRAKRRRADRKIEAARTAIARGKLREAAAAIDEIAELDPNLPELTELTTAFSAAWRNRRQGHLGPWLAAGTVFTGLVLGASWLQDNHLLLSHPLNAITGLVQTSEPEPIVPATIDTATIDIESAPPVATAGERDRDVATVAVDRAERPTRIADNTPSEPVPAVRTSPPPRPSPPIVEPEPRTAPQPAPAPATSIPQRAPLQESDLRGSANAMPAVTPAVTSAAAPAVTPAVSTAGKDEGDIKQALQRYRSAYEGLDARLARAVWPAVNEAALARAFDGLSSQTLTFDACDVELRGEAALATCRGSARYVPKVGSREPRVEPRTWSFTLRKAGNDWKIESARAER